MTSAMRRAAAELDRAMVAELEQNILDFTAEGEGPEDVAARLARRAVELATWRAESLVNIRRQLDHPEVGSAILH